MAVIMVGGSFLQSVSYIIISKVKMDRNSKENKYYYKFFDILYVYIFFFFINILLDPMILQKFFII